MKISDLDGKPFTLWLTDESDESAIFSGITRFDGSTLAIERAGKPRFEIRPEWYERIQQIRNDEVRRILLGAEYFLRLYVGNLPRSEAGSSLEHTGLKWPEERTGTE